ncbi:MAG: hypothetical protein NVSMB27_41130 [Ktedonobacteraceae bacterium]
MLGLPGVVKLITAKALLVSDTATATRGIQHLPFQKTINAPYVQYTI